MEKVVQYTEMEGGQWLPWPDNIDPPTMDALDKAKKEEFAHRWKLQTKKGRAYRYITAHSFRTSEGREWDSYNGWRPLWG